MTKKHGDDTWSKILGLVVIVLLVVTCFSLLVENYINKSIDKKSSVINNHNITTSLNDSSCTGWECNGTYVVKKDTIIALFGKRYSLRKGDGVKVYKGSVRIQTPSSSPCKDWECDGVYIVQKNKVVTLFGREYSLRKGDQVVVQKGNVNIQTEGSSKEVNHKNANITDFSFQPTYPKTNESILRGVVELGATGFNYFIIRVNSNKEWKLEKAAYGWSLVYEKMATEDLIYSTLRNYIGEILNFGVRGQNVHFVVSSGANKEANVQAITNVLREKVGYIVNIVSPEQEGKYALKCVLPKQYENTGFVVDIGSSNTKVAWLEQRRIVTRESYGAKYKQRDIADEVVRNDILQKLNGFPIKNGNICFIMGGVPHKFAKQIRKGTERYTCLNAPNAYSPKGNKQIGGHTVYNAIRDATGCNHFVFDWEANFSIGFLLSL